MRYAVCRLLTCVLLVVTSAACKTHTEAETETETEFAAEPLGAQDNRSNWAYNALRHQNRLDLDAPLLDVVMLHTHNSFNAHAYANGIRYIDPNQQFSILDQLRLGARSIEWDVHYTLGLGKKALLLCHGNNKHVGCYFRDRRLEEAILELRAFITDPAYQDQVVFIYIEDYMEGRQDLAAAAFEKYLGRWLYRPNSDTCKGIPMGIRKRDILASGARIVIMGGHDVCASSVAWRRMAFAGVGSYIDGSYPTAKIEDFRKSGCNATFTPADYARSWVRVYEDRAKLSRIAGTAGAPIDAAGVALLAHCRVNLIGLDKVTRSDPRIQAIVWSWDVNQPSGTKNQRCAVQTQNGRFANRNCAEAHAFACKNPKNGAWFVTNRTGPFSAGDAACRDESNGSARFVVSVNAQDNDALAAKRRARKLDMVWLRYTDARGTGDWQVPPQN